MAIVFTEQPINPPFPAYNNSIIEFTSDAGTPITADININGYNFEVSANAEGVFYFNMKRIIEVLINQNNFNDDIIVDDPSVFLFQDPSLYLDVNIEITVSLSDDTQESLIVSWPYLKSVLQLGKKLFNNSMINVLVPYANDVSKLTYFEGYPFDIAIYSNIDRSVTVTNLRSGLNTLINLKKGINRLFISNGENDNLGFESQLPLYLGVNELEFKASDQLYFTLLLDKRPSECGKLIKFFNQEGSWSYWRFLDLNIEKTKVGTIDRLNTDFKNVNNSTGNFSITGKQAEKSLDLFTERIDENEKKLIQQIPTSPKVYLYSNDLASPFEKEDFVEIEVDGGTFSTSSKYKLWNYNLSIKLPNIYTQTL